jgi:diguanylate cyclase (GGDEF)-like protein/PAS domain S-box-containing protein
MTNRNSSNSPSRGRKTTIRDTPIVDPAIYKLMADFAPVIIVLLDARGGIQYVNPYFEQITGYRTDELKGKDWFTTFQPARDQEAIGAVFQAAIPDTPTHGNINPIVTRGGEEREIEWSERVIRDEMGKVTSLLLIGQDVSSRRQTEVEMRNSEARLKEAQRMAHIGSWELDPRSGELIWSDEIFSLFEIDRSRFGATYDAFLDTIHPDDRDKVNQAYTDSLATQSPYEITHRLLMRDGRIKWVEERCVTEFDAEGRPLRSRGTVQDVTERQQAEDKILAAKRQLQATLDAVPDLLFEVGLDGRYYNFHSPRVDLLAVPAEDFIGKKISDILPLDVSELAMSALRDAHEKGWSRGKQYELKLPQGKRWFELSIARKSVDAGQEPRFIALSRDITERKQAESELRQTQHLMNSIVDNIPVMVFVKRAADLRFELFNRAGETLLGYSRSDLLGKTDYELFPEEQADFFIAEDRKALASDVVTEIPQEPIKTSTGETRYLHTWKIALRDDAGEPTHLIGISIDITERKKIEEQIRNLAFYDTLTNLPNRRLLSDRLHQTMAASNRSRHYGALMFIDLDNFKPLNDRYGHDMGDLLLMEVARRIAHCVREMDTIARFGGDEFIVMLSELDINKESSIAQAGLVADKIRAALSEPYKTTLRQSGEPELTVEYRCTSSIGVALFLGHESSPEEILKRADIAMYQAKEGGRNLVHFYEE